MCAFDLAERQAVDLKNVRCRAQELERVGFSAIVPPSHVYPKIVLYRTTGLPFFQKLMPDPRDSRDQGRIPVRPRHMHESAAKRLTTKAQRHRRIFPPVIPSDRRAGREQRRQ
jgi:hypothetical protein